MTNPNEYYDPRFFAPANSGAPPPPPIMIPQYGGSHTARSYHTTTAHPGSPILSARMSGSTAATGQPLPHSHSYIHTHHTHTPDVLQSRRYNPYGLVAGLAAQKSGVPLPLNPLNSPTMLTAQLQNLNYYPHSTPQPNSPARALIPNQLQPLDPAIYHPNQSSAGKFPPIQPPHQAWTDDSSNGQQSQTQFHQPFLAPLHQQPRSVQSSPASTQPVAQYPAQLIQQQQQQKWEQAYQQYLAQYAQMQAQQQPQGTNSQSQLGGDGNQSTNPEEKVNDPSSNDAQMDFAQQQLQQQQQQAAMAQAAALYMYGHTLQPSYLSTTRALAAPPPKPAPDKFSTFAWLRDHEIEANRILRGERIGLGTGGRRRSRRGRKLEGEISSDSEAEEAAMMFGSGRTTTDRNSTVGEYLKRSSSPRSTSRTHRRKKRQSKNKSASNSPSRQAHQSEEHKEQPIPAYMRNTQSYNKQLELKPPPGSAEALLAEHFQEQEHPQLQSHHPHPPNEKLLAEQAEARAARFALRSRQLKAKIARISTGKTVERKRAILELEQAEKEERVREYRATRGAKPIMRGLGQVDARKFETVDENTLAKVGGVTLHTSTSHGKKTLSTTTGTASLAKLPTSTLQAELDALHKLEENVRKELQKRLEELEKSGGGGNKTATNDTPVLTDSLVDADGNLQSVNPADVTDPVLLQARADHDQATKEAQQEEEHRKLREAKEAEAKRLAALNDTSEADRARLEAKRIKKEKEAAAKLAKRLEGEKIDAERRAAKAAEAEKEKERELKRLEKQREATEKAKAEFAARAKERQAKAEQEKREAEEAKAKEDARLAKKAAKAKEIEDEKREKAYQARLKQEREQEREAHILQLAKSELKKEEMARKMAKLAAEAEGGEAPTKDEAAIRPESAAAANPSAPSSPTPTSPKLSTKKSKPAPTSSTKKESKETTKGSTKTPKKPAKEVESKDKASKAAKVKEDATEKKEDGGDSEDKTSTPKKSKPDASSKSPTTSTKRKTTNSEAPSSPKSPKPSTSTKKPAAAASSTSAKKADSPPPKPPSPSTSNKKAADKKPTKSESENKPSSPKTPTKVESKKKVNESEDENEPSTPKETKPAKKDEIKEEKPIVPSKPTPAVSASLPSVVAPKPVVADKEPVKEVQPVAEVKPATETKPVEKPVEAVKPAATESKSPQEDEFIQPTVVSNATTTTTPPKPTPPPIATKPAPVVVASSTAAKPAAVAAPKKPILDDDFDFLDDPVPSKSTAAKPAAPATTTSKSSTTTTAAAAPVKKESTAAPKLDDSVKATDAPSPTPVTKVEPTKPDSQSNAGPIEAKSPPVAITSPVAPVATVDASADSRPVTAGYNDDQFDSFLDDLSDMDNLPTPISPSNATKKPTTTATTTSTAAAATPASATSTTAPPKPSTAAPIKPSTTSAPPPVKAAAHEFTADEKLDLGELDAELDPVDFDF